MIVSFVSRRLRNDRVVTFSNPVVGSSISLRMVDRTKYDSEEKIALRQISGRLNLKSELCKSAANAGLLSVEIFAMLGDSAKAAKDQIKILIPEDELGSTAPERDLAGMQLAAVWLACSALQTQFASRRARMEEDPSKIPEMAQEDHAEFRARFVRTHPDVVLLDAREPHKKFVEKVSRDFLVHGMVPYYAVAEIRTRADTIIQKTGLTKTAEDLLTVSKADEPEAVTDANTLIHRVHALFMTLEYLNICQYNRAGGPLKYIQELEQFRSDTSSLPVLMMADSLIRKKPYRLQSEQRESFGTFSEALLEVITNHKYLWNDARMKAALVPASSVPKTTLKDEGVGDHLRLESPEKSAAPRSEKKKRQRERRKALLKEAKAAKLVKKDHLKNTSEVKAVTKDKRIPDSEWKSISEASNKVSGAKRCHYFNSSMGCSMGDKRRFKHTCMVCGSAHSMVGNH